MSNKLNLKELEILLRHWKQQHGEAGKSFNGIAAYYVPVDQQKRQSMYRILLSHLIKKHNYTEEDLRDSACFDTIITRSVNMKHSNRDALNKWIKFAQHDLTTCIDELFPVILEK